MISRAKSSEQNDDKTNNSDDVILRHSLQLNLGRGLTLLPTASMSREKLVMSTN